MQRDIKESKLFFSFVTAILFLSFAFNIFGVVSEDKFQLDFKDSEALVSNRIICGGEQFGGQLLSVAQEELNTNNSLMADDCSESKLTAYYSHFGFQGRLLGFGHDAAELLFKNFGPKEYIVIAQLLMALASATLFGVFVLWTKQRYGTFVATFVMLAIALSPMLVGFGRNLYWALPFMVAPFVFSLYYYRSTDRGLRRVIFWAIITLLLYLRYLTGYEYITTFTIMVFAAIAYHLYLDRAPVKDYATKALTTLIVSVAAFALAITTHVISLASYAGSVENATQSIAERAEERTISAERYTTYPFQRLEEQAPGLQSTIVTYIGSEKYGELANSGSLFIATIVNVAVYLLIPVVVVPFELKQPFGLYIQSTAMFLTVLAIAFITRERWMPKARRQETEALFIGALLGFVGYASWIVLGFSHSLVHAHINGILAYLPMALFGFIAIALYTESLMERLRKKSKR